jgi:hypothetical protein
MKTLTLAAIIALAGASMVSAQTTFWPNTPPGDCPFSKSELFEGVELTGRHAQYGNADRWYPSWAKNNK